MARDVPGPFFYRLGAGIERPAQLSPRPIGLSPKNYRKGAIKIRFTILPAPGCAW